MKFLKESLKTIQKQRQKGIVFYRLDENDYYNSHDQKGFFVHMEDDTENNVDYRRVLFTTEDTQLVLMSIKPGEEIGTETHDGSQFIRFEAGEGKVIMGEDQYHVIDGDAVIVPAGVEHNVINTSNEDLKLYALYSPPQHEPGQIDHTKEDEQEHDDEINYEDEYNNNSMHETYDRVKSN